MNHVWKMRAHELARRTSTGEIRVEQVAETFLRRVQAIDPSLGAFLAIDVESVSERARALDAARERGVPCGPLHGVPVALKDNLCTRGLATTASSKILERFIPPYSATVVTRLEHAGALLLGKTNLDEFAMGSSTENSAFGPTRNPWDLERTPGGSSGGSAAAVAARLVPLALGSDTGGSIRQPAAFCGVVGLKPTYGRVSRFGLLAFASSLDQIGPFAAAAEDAALLFQAIAGHDANDATSAQEAVEDWRSQLTADVRALRIGVPRAFISAGVDSEVSAAFEEALRVLGDRGASVVDIDLPHAPFAIPVYYLIATAEASSNLARYDGVRYGFRAATTRNETLHSMYERTREQGFGEEVKRRIMLGTYVLSAGYYDAYYVKAQQVRTLLRRDYAQAFESVDLVATPTSPTLAFRLGERVDDPLQMYLADVFTVSANLAGLPAISIPCGFSAGLPIGLQLTARMFDERTLLRAADAYQRDTNWHETMPPVPLTA